MIVYYILILVIMSGVFMPLSDKTIKKTYCCIVSSLMILICGFRSKYLGPVNSWGVTDTQNVHIPDFLESANTSWINIVQYWLKNSNSHFRDLGASLFYKVISCFSDNEYFFVFISSIPIFIVIGRFIYKYSSNPVMSYVLLLGLNYFTGAMYLTRAMLAISIVVLAYDDLYNNNIRVYIIKIIIACLFHKTALVALVILPLRRCKWNKKHVACIVIGLLIGLWGRNLWNWFLLKLISLIPWWNYYMTRDTINEFGQTWFIAIAILLCVVVKKDALYKEDDQFATINVNLLTIGCVCYGFMSLLLEFSRIAMFFMPAAIILLPDSINAGKTNKKSKLIISSGIYVAFIFYFLVKLVNSSGANPYRFYWQ